MSRAVRILKLATAALVLLAVPFALLGPRLEGSLPGLLERIRRPELMFVAVVAALASDILLPIPSSVVSTLAGGELGAHWGAAASWLGMTGGAAAGFGLARAFGRPLVVRLTSADDLAALDRLGERQGVLLIVLLRAVPLLAEASVLVLGASDMPWRRFVPSAALANLGIALAYACFGAFARDHQWLPGALAASLALPLVLTWSLRPVLRGGEGRGHGAPKENLDKRPPTGTHSR
jgi:uncharacterized membrane protein YdjX (TVP38/TMEM64 family)